MRVKLSNWNPTMTTLSTRGLARAAALALVLSSCQSRTDSAAETQADTAKLAAEPADKLRSPSAPAATPSPAASDKGEEPAAQEAAAQALKQPATAPPSQTPSGAKAPPPTEPVEAEAVAAKQLRGKVGSAEGFATWLEATSPATVGQPVAVRVVLEAKAPYHPNAEYPHKFKLDPAPASLGYPQGVVKGMKVTDQRGVLELPVQAKSPGTATVSGSLSFSVCTDERCLIEKQTLAVQVEVTE
jgi:hypothetical protein